MSEPLAAVRKAEVMRDYAVRTGYRLSTFAVALTAPEAAELVEALEAGRLGLYANMGALKADCARAKQCGDPFYVLQHIQLFGLDLLPAKALH